MLMIKLTTYIHRHTHNLFAHNVYRFRCRVCELRVDTLANCNWLECYVMGIIIIIIIIVYNNCIIQPRPMPSGHSSLLRNNFDPQESRFAMHIRSLPVPIPIPIPLAFMIVKVICSCQADTKKSCKLWSKVCFLSAWWLDSGNQVKHTHINTYIHTVNCQTVHTQDSPQRHTLFWMQWKPRWRLAILRDRYTAI